MGQAFMFWKLGADFKNQKSVGDASVMNSRSVCSPLLCFKVELVALCWAGNWLALSPFSAVVSRRCLRSHCWCVFLSPQLVNRHLYSGSADRTVKCWFVDTGERIQTYKAHKHSVSTLKYHAGICKLPFPCSPAPSLPIFVFDWRLLMENNFECLWRCRFFSTPACLPSVPNCCTTPCGKLRPSLHFPPPSSHKWRDSCFVSVTKGSGLNSEPSGGCLCNCGSTSLVWCLSPASAACWGQQVLLLDTQPCACLCYPVGTV